MSDPDDIPRVLLGLARDDRLAANALLPVEGVTDAILGFHAQQAVEKALKAVLALREVDFPFTHDLDGLLELCRENGIDVPGELSEVDRLSPFGVQLRYGASTPSGLDRDQALDWAASAVEWAQSFIEPVGNEPVGNEPADS
jgi:HEPN domain-containing protein